MIWLFDSLIISREVASTTSINPDVVVFWKKPVGNGELAPSIRTLIAWRFTRGPNGSIPWDFMFAPNQAATRPGDQYQDVLFTQIDLFVRLKYARVGYLNFNAANVDILRVMATRVLNEKKKQTTRFAENWNDHDFVVHKELVRTWEKMVHPLEEMYQQWNFPENEGTSICLERSLVWLNRFDFVFFVH